MTTMHCPRCAVEITEETNFCNKCGFRLRADSLQPRKPAEHFDWSKTWLVDMLLTDDERMRRRAATAIADSPESTTFAEMKRARELKAGIVTAFAGIGSSIFLWFFLGALAGVVEAQNPDAAVVLRHVWAAGVIPLFVGLGMILSALFVDAGALRPRLAGSPRRDGRTTSGLPALEAPPVAASVTEHTTELLVESAAGSEARPAGNA
jgi:hypothetical protein